MSNRVWVTLKIAARVLRIYSRIPDTQEVRALIVRCIGEGEALRNGKSDLSESKSIAGALLEMAGNDPNNPAGISARRILRAISDVEGVIQ